MTPTLMMGDFLFANKFKYGFHVPFSEIFGSKPTYLSEEKSPERGDVVIFAPPEAGQESLYIKRIIGIPGDRIRFEGKKVFLNGTAVDREELQGSERDAILNHKGFDPEDRYQKDKLHIFREHLDHHTYLTLEDDNYDGIKTDSEVVIPEDQYYVLGDNRDDTRDSRVFGTIKRHSIRGKAFVIWLSYRISLTDSHWSFRADRIGRIIQ